MNKLKTLLQSNKYIIILLLVTILITCIRVIPSPNICYTEKDNKVIGIITKEIIKDDYVTIEIKGEEKVRGTYYFNTQEEKENYQDKYQLGDKIKVLGKITVPETPGTKTSFNYKKYLERKNIYHLIEITSIKKIEDNRNIYYQGKDIIKNYITNPYIKSFLLGDDSNIKEEAIDSYNENGISHLFAISGMHFQILSTMILKLLSKTNLKDKTKYKIIIPILLLYTALIGLTASIIRGILFFFLFSIKKLYHLNISKTKLILITILITIIINPYYVTEVAFYYSFIISIGLIYFMPKNNSYLKTLLISSTLAFFLSIPISLYYFYQINILSIIYNLFYIPYINMIIFPLSILTLLLPILEPFYNFLTSILEKSSIFLSNIKIGIFIFPKVSITIYIIYFVLIILIMKKRKKRVITLLLLLIFIHYYLPYTKEYIKVIDVGQGDSILFYSKGKTALIDTGGKYKEGSVAKYITMPLLKSLGIRKIDKLLLSHGDKDHIGDAIYLIEKYQVDEIYLNLGQKNEVEKLLPNTKTAYQDLTLPVGNFIFYQLNKEYKEENNSSSVYYVEHPNLTLLLTGDIPKEVEDEILNHYTFTIDILKVGHHGSDTSTGNNLLKTLKPSLAIISVGKDNSYNHPSPKTLTRLNKTNTPYLTTIKSGTITIIPKTQEVIEDRK